MPNTKQYDIQYIKLFVAIVSITASLAACETSKTVAQRQSQFNGQKISSVVAKIGQPNRISANEAIWTYSRDTVNFEPIYKYNQHGQASIAGNRRQKVTLNCTFTAKLSAGRVVKSTYQGNNCKRYAPDLKK